LTHRQLRAIRLLHAIAVAALPCFLPHPAAAQTVDLRPQWTEGQTALYEFWNQRQQTTTMSLGPNQREAAMTVTTEGQTRWTVDKVNDDGSSQCTMTLEWITAEIENNGQTQVNDSRKGSGDSETMHAFLQAMAGVPLKVSVNADGSIESVEGVDQMKRNLGSELESLIPEPLDFVESATDLATIPHAPAEAEPGDTFSADYRWTHELGHTDQDWTYELESVEELEGVRVATVTGEGGLKLDVDRSEMPPDAPPTDIRMTDAEATSQVFFDLSRHEAIGRHGTQDTTIEVNITLPNNRGTLKRVTEQKIQSQTLRVEESG
jgi:hypothetical protein